MKNVFLTMFVIMLGTISAQADDFVRVDGTKLIGRDGQSLVMRGTNCGNWMVREPYMMNTEGRLDRQFKFDKMIADICGEEKVAEFDQLWMDNNFNEEDMKFLAELGFNTLRVPMHYKYFTLPIEKEPTEGEQTWLDEGFERIDKMCEWAERYNILLILDMHACPGGQSSGDICDYDESKPSLWEEARNRSKLVALWKKIAERYKDQKCVETPQDNMLTNSECEFQGAWRTAALQSINDAKFTWNSATNKPSKGTGNCWSDEAWHVYHHQ